MNKNEPLFKSIFSTKWDSLPTVLKKHYANKPYSHDVVTVKERQNEFHHCAVGAMGDAVI